jgi:hypothetical protein
VTALADLHSALDALDEALARQHSAARRLTTAREALEATTAELYGEAAILGTTREERDACLYRLTRAERHEISEAQAALDAAALAVELARNNLNRHSWQVAR